MTRGHTTPHPVVDPAACRQCQRIDRPQRTTADALLAHRHADPRRPPLRRLKARRWVCQTPPINRLDQQRRGRQFPANSPPNRPQPVSPRNRGARGSQLTRYLLVRRERSARPARRAPALPRLLQYPDRATTVSHRIGAQSWCVVAHKPVAWRVAELPPTPPRRARRA